MTNEENKLIESVKKGVLRKFPLLGATMSNMEFVSAENMGVDTCATDGEKVFYSKKFLNNLSEQERVFAVSHELMHVAFDHILRSKGRDMEVWNYATDSVINQMLKSEDIWWNGAFDMKEAVNKSAEEMYNILMEQKKQQQKRQGMQGQNGQNGRCENNQQNGQSQNQSGMGENGSPNNQQSGQNNQSPNNGQNRQSQGMNSQGSQMPQSPTQNPQNNNSYNQGQSGQDGQKGTNNQNGQIGNSQGKQSQAERKQNGSNQGQKQQSQNQSGQSGDEDKTQKHQDANSGEQNNASKTDQGSGNPNKSNTNGQNSNNTDNLNDSAESGPQGENSEINQNSVNKPQQNSQSGLGQAGQNQANKPQNNASGHQNMQNEKDGQKQGENTELSKGQRSLNEQREKKQLNGNSGAKENGVAGDANQSIGKIGQLNGESGSTELSGDSDKNQQKDGEGVNQSSNGTNANQANKGEGIGNENGENETSLNQSDMDLSKFGEMHSTHSMWEEAVKKAEKKEQESKKSKLSEFINKFKKIDTDTLSKSNETHSSTGKMGTTKSYDTLEKDFLEDNKELKKEIASRIRSRLYSSQGASKDGGNGGGHAENYGYIEQQKAILSWKKLLKSEIESEESRWSYRRADEDNYYQARIGSIYEQNKPIVQVMIDTSGSVSKAMIKQFLAQTKTLLKDCIVFVSCFDTKVYGFSQIKTQNDIDQYTIRGGGGTSFDAALKGFSKDKRVYKIIFTDGEDTVTPTVDVKKMQRVVWLVWKQNSFKPCVGKVIRVDKETLKTTQRDDGLGR